MNARADASSIQGFSCDETKDNNERIIVAQSFRLSELHKQHMMPSACGAASWDDLKSSHTTGTTE